ncbi:PEPxxWA-CTERM sorting domain-containing protein [Sphingomonas sp. KRR8]|uniref:PEPxxWA-CTERM sorting domain-containing protein n=1 Tax=Sphingomonas sp. KRR8 TaxID=2942996 RepID=UPI00201FC262|nr:PEPxxWA-CTERM sorting domain-containing protein [Sphingomonas sp. KRR8]URD62154.1 PEPxxWA-CTERM sorting domain-containing protein [Sphingomonas sp. KRR8]
MPTLRSLFTTAALAVTAMVASPASAANIIGGSTSVTLTSAPVLTSAGLTVGTTGTATVALNGDGLPVATFPITGGSTNDQTGAALISHDGSGLSFSNGLGALLNIGNFVIDTSALTVNGYASANGGAASNLTLFNLGSGNTLLLSSGAASAFNSVFGLNLAAGTQIGVAQVNPITAAAAVPEPSTWALMLFGFGAAGVAIRRQRRMALAAA